MSHTHHMEEQARRAERLARGIGDDLTVQRLMAFAAECRAREDEAGPGLAFTN